MTVKTRTQRIFLGLSAAGMALAAAPEPALKDLMPRSMLIGAALNQAQSDGQDAIASAIVTRHFNTISPENLLKWESVHPEPDRFTFDAADRYVAFGQQHGLFIVGHTLIWHQQTPKWVFVGKDGTPVDRETLLERMRVHIETVVGRFRGRVHGWDVVNEALADDGTLRKSPWLQAIGEDFIIKAFEFAQRADPNAQLYYNDYSLTNAAKRAGALRIVQQLKAKGIRIDGVGEQGHWLLSRPSLEEIDSTLTEIGAAGVKGHITELDMDVLPREPGMYGADLDAKAKFKAETNLYPDGLPSDKQQELAQRYAAAFKLFLKHRDTLARVTFWGVSDRHSWLNNFPISGRVNHPLLWDREGHPKPAFHAVVRVLQESRAGSATRGSIAWRPSTGAQGVPSRVEGRNPATVHGLPYVGRVPRSANTSEWTRRSFVPAHPSIGAVE
jgi:endo-1,4-beta-xylanase